MDDQNCQSIFVVKFHMFTRDGGDGKKKINIK